MALLSYSWTDEILEPLLHQVVTRWILELPGAGCSWYKKTGGCTMCGFNRATYKYNFGGKLLPHFCFMTLVWTGWLIVKKQKPKTLYVYNGGNFINPLEIPLKTQTSISRFVARSATLKKLFIEMRPQFVVGEKETLRKLKGILGDKQLQIGIGFETQDDRMRNKVLRKGMLKKDLQTAIDIARNLGIKTLVYVFLKPPYVEERESIEEAIKTIRYCFEIGADEVSLSCAFVQRNTLLEKLWLEKKFTPPMLKSIIEVVKATKNLGSVRIGTFTDSPPPLAIPEGTSQQIGIIERYRKTHQL